MSEPARLKHMDLDPDSPRANRKCGNCTECCRVIGVPEISKPGYMRCPHEKRNCCSIYEDRPESCRNYSCYWKEGYLTHRHKPNRFHVLFDASETFLLHSIWEGIEVVCVRPTKPNAHLSKRAQITIKALTKELAVIIIDGRKRKLLGPPAMVQLIRSRAQAKATKSGTTPEVELETVLHPEDA